MKQTIRYAGSAFIVAGALIAGLALAAETEERKEKI
jgi:hypothetical protein